jgi:hypothetical protein
MREFAPDAHHQASAHQASAIAASHQVNDSRAQP